MARSNRRGEVKGRGQDRVRLPQPAMKQLQPMPVAPQQGGGNRISRPVERPVGRPQQVGGPVERPVGVAQETFQGPPRQDDGIFNFIEQGGGNNMPRPPFRFGYSPVTLTEPNQQPIAAEAPITDMMVKPPYTGAGTAPMPYASGITSIATGLDPTTKQMLFGLDGQGGFIPGAMQAAESTFFNPDGTPRVVDQTVAGLTDDQRQAMEMARSNVGALNPYIGEAGGLLRETTGGFDRSQIDKFNDPYEEKVVQQAIEDMRKYGAQEDIADTAQAIGSGGLSAFGERAGKFAGEKASGRERGMLEAIAGIRSQGFDRSRTLAMTEQARMNEAKRQAASGLLGIGGVQQKGSAFDINQLLGSGGLQQAQSQAEADAIRANMMAKQQAPLAQYQALAPFISMAPAGTYQTQTQYAPKPSPLLAGLGTGLSAFGAIGNLLNPKTT